MLLVRRSAIAIVLSVISMSVLSGCILEPAYEDLKARTIWTSIYKPDNYYVAEDFESLLIKKVAVRPWKNGTGSNKLDQHVALWQREYFLQLREVGMFQATQVDNRVTDAQLLKQGYHAVISGTLRQVEMTGPIILGVDMAMTYLPADRTVWTIQETFDATNRSVQNLVKKYYYENTGSSHMTSRWESYLTSPKLFYRFVGFQMMETLLQETLWRNRATAFGVISHDHR